MSLRPWLAALAVLLTAPVAAQQIRGDIHYRLHTTYRGPEQPLSVLNGSARDGAAKLAARAEVQNQFWRIAVAGDGFARITSMFRGPWECLEMIGSGGFLTGGAEMRRCDGSPAQSWKLEREDGGFRLRNRAAEKDQCLEAITGGGEDGLAAMRPCGFYGTQFWVLEPTGHVAK